MPTKAINCWRPRQRFVLTYKVFLLSNTPNYKSVDKASQLQITESETICNSTKSVLLQIVALKFLYFIIIIYF